MASRDRLLGILQATTEANGKHYSPLSCHLFGDEDPYLPPFPDFDDLPLL